MLQINVTTLASDALEDAMRLAQVKALNSFTFSDCLNFLNYAWSDIYNRMATIDDGYYGVNIKLTKKLTKLPAFVKSTVQVYAAQSPIDHNRDVYREASNSDLVASNTYKLSGQDLYCADAERRTIWLYYVPACPQLFFTHHNRDPKLYEKDPDELVTDYISKYRKYNDKYNIWKLVGSWQENDETKYVDWTASADDIRTQIQQATKWEMVHLTDSTQADDITDRLKVEMSDSTDGTWNIVYISCDFPYIFITYEHSITHEHVSGFFTRDMEFVKYNPFDYTGRNSDVEYLDCHWNDKTGMGVIVLDYSDTKVKELGWTPDTVLKYPKPEMYRYLVARLADKFAALNESDVMGVQRELVEARYAFEAFFDTDKSAWKHITNVNPANYADWL